LLSTVVKSLVSRPRPVAGEQLRVVVAPLGGSSFPSGHVLSYVGLYGFAAYLAEVLIRPIALRRTVVGALLGLVALVGPSRIQQGHQLVHRRDRLISAWDELRGRSRRAVPAGEGSSCTGSGVTRRCRVLRNPAAGPRRGLPRTRSRADELLALLKRHGLGAEVIETADEDDTRRETRRAVREGLDVVVAAGGDGTIGAVAEELLDTPSALGVLPLGTVMNIPRMLGVSRDLDEAAATLASGPVRCIDVGQANGRAFFEAASVGMNAAMFREANRFERGDWLSIARTIWVALRYRPARMRLELDEDGVEQTRALMVVIANGPYTGAGMTVAPDAQIDDGRFDVRVFRGFSKPELLRHPRFDRVRTTPLRAPCIDVPRLDSPRDQRFIRCQPEPIRTTSGPRRSRFACGRACCASSAPRRGRKSQRVRGCGRSPHPRGGSCCPARAIVHRQGGLARPRSPARRRRGDALIEEGPHRVLAVPAVVAPKRLVAIGSQQDAVEGSAAGISCTRAAPAVPEVIDDHSEPGVGVADGGLDRGAPGQTDLLDERIAPRWVRQDQARDHHVAQVVDRDVDAPVEARGQRPADRALAHGRGAHDEEDG
jgi:diacylglycerol kinase (ATP)